MKPAMALLLPLCKAGLAACLLCGQERR